MDQFINKTKESYFFVVIAFIICFVNPCCAQLPEKKASFNLGRIRLEISLFKLKDIYGVNFSYGNNIIPLNRQIELRATDKTLKEVLDEILPAVGVTYKLVGNTISLKAIQLKQNIRGKIIDKTSGEAIAGVNVILLDLDSLVGSVTDESGIFLMRNVTIGHYSLKASFVGYEDAIERDAIVNSGKEPFITMSMRQSVVSLGEVVVRPNLVNGQPINNFSLSGGRSFSVEETKRFASNFNDPARMMTAYPGIAANNDATNSMAVRGNSPNGMQWRMEGVEIPSPNHFSAFGSSGGAISMLSLNMLDNSDFFSGAFAAEYGNALSGVMDIKLRKGNNQKSEKAFQVGVIGLDMAAEGPFKKRKNSSYLVNYRYSTLGLMENLGFFPAGAVPEYQDLSFNLAFPKGSGTTNVWGIAGNGIINEDQNGGNKSHLQTKSAIGGITHRRSFSNHSSLIVTASASANMDELTHSVIVNPQATETSSYRHNESQSFRISTQFNKKFSPRSALRSGAVFSYQHYNLTHQFIDYSNNKTMAYPLSAGGGTGYVQIYSQWKKYLNDRVTLNAGLHGIFFVLNNHYSVEPRLGLNYEVSPSENVSFASGLHSRIQPLTLYFGEVQQTDGTTYAPNRNLDFSKALHYVASYDKVIKESFHFRTEIYYQHLYNIPVYYESIGPVKYTSYSAINVTNEYINTTLQENLPFPLANTGQGKNYGLEFTFEKFFSNNYYFLITNSLFQSRYRGSDNIERNTQFNSQHIFTALAGKEYCSGIGKNNVVELNARITWTGNNRQTPIDVAASRAANSVVYDYTRSFEEKLSDYFRLDLHFGLRKNKSRTSHIWSFDLRNATNRQNAGYEILNFQTGKIDYAKQLGLIPVLNYRIEF